MRIVGGELRGRRLQAPSGRSVRPTSDRARETLFNVLQHRFDGLPEGVRVLDLFAGTGALGLEALSRGAKFCLFVEQDAAARGVIRENVEAFGLQGVARIFRRDATRLGPAGTAGPFELAFADPPYGHGLGERALQSAAAGGWLADGALIAAEESEAVAFAVPPGFALIDRLEIGAAAIHLLRYRPDGSGGGATIKENSLSRRD